MSTRLNAKYYNLSYVSHGFWRILDELDQLQVSSFTGSIQLNRFRIKVDPALLQSEAHRRSKGFHVTHLPDTEPCLAPFDPIVGACDEVHIRPLDRKRHPGQRAIGATAFDSRVRLVAMARADPVLPVKAVSIRQAFAQGALFSIPVLRKVPPDAKTHNAYAVADFRGADVAHVYRVAHGAGRFYA